MNNHEEIIDVTGSLNELRGKNISLKGRVYKAGKWKWTRSYGNGELTIKISLSSPDESDSSDPGSRVDHEKEDVAQSIARSRGLAPNK